MNSNTQNAKIEAITEITLVLGIDVGSETHYARAFDYRGIEYSKKPFKFSNTEAGFVTFKAWILDLEEKHGKDKVVPGMEPTGHYWFNLGKFLQDHEMKPVLVNPHHVKKSKELDDNNPTKNDRKDGLRNQKCTSSGSNGSDRRAGKPDSNGRKIVGDQGSGNQDRVWISCRSRGYQPLQQSERTAEACRIGTG